MAAELRSSAAHVFVPDIESPVLEAGDHHHLARVLRLRPGQVVTVSDGAGGWRPCAWSASSGPSDSMGSAVEVTGQIRREAAPTPAITVGFALTKGQRSDWVVQKLTEAGVDRLVPITAATSVVRWDPSTAAGHVDRWRRLAREAAMQARRVWLPEVHGVASFEHALSAGAAGPGPQTGPGFALAEPGGEDPSLTRPAVLVGPEGGWAPEELSAGMPTVSLGPTIMRAETAALASGILLCALRARLVG